MKKNPKIKVIKKSRVITTQPPPTKEKSSKQTTNREIASTIGDWIKDFQQDRFKESKVAIDSLSLLKTH